MSFHKYMCQGNRESDAVIHVLPTCKGTNTSHCTKTKEGIA